MFHSTRRAGELITPTFLLSVAECMQRGRPVPVREAEQQVGFLLRRVAV